MNVFDLIILVLLVIFVLRGAMKGMVSQVVSVGSYLVCWIFASRFAFIIAPSIPAVEPWNQVGAIAVLFIIALVGIRFLHSMAEKWIKNRSLAYRTNMLLGGGLGFIKAVLMCMVITFFGVMLSESTRTVIFNSKSGLKISQLIVKTGAFIPKGSCSILEERLAKFTATVDGTPLDPDNEGESTAKMLQDALNELKQTVDQYAQKNPSEESNFALKSAFNDILSRGDTLLEKTKQIEATQTPQPAASLLDGVLRWWSGKPVEPEPETDAGSGKLTSQLAAQKEAIQNEINNLIQEGKKTVQEKINNQTVEKNHETLADIKPVVPKEVNTSDLLPNAAKTLQQSNNVQQNSWEPIALSDADTVKNTVSALPQSSGNLRSPLVENTAPDITALPFLQTLQEEPAEQNIPQIYSQFAPQMTPQAVPLPRRAESFILQNNRHGRLKTADILNNKPLTSDSVSSSQPAVLFQQ